LQILLPIDDCYGQSHDDNYICHHGFSSKIRMGMVRGSHQHCSAPLRCQTKWRKEVWMFKQAKKKSVPREHPSKWRHQ
jgi:hypothetical protein